MKLCVCASDRVLAGRLRLGSSPICDGLSVMNSAVEGRAFGKISVLAEFKPLITAPVPAMFCESDCESGRT